MPESPGVNLLLAQMDLGLVRLLRGAIRAADLGAAAAVGVGVCPEFRPAAVFTPTPRFEPRVVYHPTPRFEPRPVYHPTPRFEPLEPCPAPCQPEQARIEPSCIPPVWKTLPSIASPSAVQPIKVHLVQPDIRHKGTLIDSFL